MGAPGEQAASGACASTGGVPAATGALGGLQRLSGAFWGEGPPGSVCVQADVKLCGRNLRVSTGCVCAGLCDDLQHIFAL